MLDGRFLGEEIVLRDPGEIYLLYRDVVVLLDLYITSSSLGDRFARGEHVRALRAVLFG